MYVCTYAYNCIYTKCLDIMYIYTCTIRTLQLYKYQMCSVPYSCINIRCVLYSCINIRCVLILSTIRTLQFVEISQHICKTKMVSRCINNGYIKRSSMPHHKLLGCGVSTPAPLFFSICTIISNRTGHLD